MISMRLEGGAKLAATLRKITPSQERAKLLGILKTAAEPMRGRASQLAPIEPGLPDLKDHIGISVANRIGDPTTSGRWRQREETEHAVAVGPEQDYFYGLFQEYGVPGRHGAQPFMRPAFDETMPEMFRLLQDGIWRLLRELADRHSGGGRNL